MGQCSHMYHRHCIMDWLRENDSCPSCRQNMWEAGAYETVKAEILHNCQRGVQIAEA